MSLLSPKSLHLHIDADCVQALHLSGRSNRVTGLQQRDLGAAPKPDPAALVLAAMDLVEAHRPDRVQVVIASALVRYFCVPWQANLRNQAEEDAWTRWVFEDIYGNADSSAWTLRWSDERPGKSRLVAAIHNDLLHGLQAGLAQRHARLVSVQPHVISVLRAYAGTLPSEACLASLEPGRMTLVAWNATGWSWAHSVRCTASTVQASARLAQREWALSGRMPEVGPTGTAGRIFLSTPMAADGAPPTDTLEPGLVVLPPLRRTVHPAEGQDIRAYASAMLGVAP